MEKQKRFRYFSVPLVMIMISLINYSHLKGTENIRAIHIVSLITIGVGIGLFIAALIAFFKK